MTGSGKRREDPRFFASPAELRAWFERNYRAAVELHVGYYKKGTGRPSVTWPESVDQALCFGWIDGVRHSVDAGSYTIRFTPRKPKSTWSAVNIARATELTAQGLMTPEGLRAFEARDQGARQYSYEAKGQDLAETYRKQFEASSRAWAFFGRQPPSYRKMAAHWVMSAKKEETRQKRLEALIAASEKGLRHGVVTGGKKPAK